MAAESIIGLRRPEFPKTESTESGLTTRIEYIGDTTTILAALPLLSAAWGDYPGLVKTANSHPTENTAITIAVVTTFLEIDNENTTEGELVSETFEIDWIPVERPMKEHPQFAIGEGGANALTARDIVDIDRWKAETNTPELREVYKYHDKTSAGGEFVTLSTNAKLFARGIEIGDGRRLFDQGPFNSTRTSVNCSKGCEKVIKGSTNCDHGRVFMIWRPLKTRQDLIGATLDDFLATLGQIYTGPCRIEWALIKSSPPIF